MPSTASVSISLLSWCCRVAKSPFLVAFIALRARNAPYRLLDPGVSPAVDPIAPRAVRVHLCPPAEEREGEGLRVLQTGFGLSS